MEKSVFGLNENVASLLCYVGLYFSGIIILVMEKNNKTVRFHALQSILWFMVLSIVGWVLGWIPLIGGLLGPVIGLLTLVSWAFLIYNAYMGKRFKIPLIGDAVETQIYR